MRSKYKWIFTLLVALSVQFSFAQEKTVTGVVSDASGSLPGANVVVQGTKTSTQTDISGKYSIKAKAGDVLVFSFVGMSDSTVKVGASNSYNVKMSAGKELDVVNVGYGRKIIKTKQGAAVSTVSGKALEDRPNINFLANLQGQAPGVSIAFNSGSPGSNKVDVIIRGESSLNGTKDPLYVIDGVPLNQAFFRNLNPDDIESLSILKDASATAIYGNRGTNGVVVITTKKGKFNGGFSVSYSSMSGQASMPDNKYNLTNGKELIQYQRDIMPAIGITPVFGNSLTQAQADSWSTNTDWSKVFFRTANSKQHTLSFTSGSENMNNYTSFGYMEQDGLLRNSEFKRFTFRTNFNGKSKNDKFNYSTNISANFSKRRQVEQETRASIGNNIVQNPVNGFLKSPGYLDPNFYQSGQQIFNVFGFNVSQATPYTLMDLLNGNNLANFYHEVKIFANVDMSYKLAKNLTYSVNFGIDSQDDKRVFANGPDSYLSIVRNASLATPLAFRGQETQTNIVEFSANMVNKLNYNRVFKDKHTVDLTVFTEYFKGHRRVNLLQNNGLNPLTWEPGAGTGWVPFSPTTPTAFNKVVQASTANAGMLSYFAVADYDFNDLLGLNASYRRDNSYKFTGDNKWGTFWSAAARVNLHKLSAIEKLGIIDELKLRASYGNAGNQNITARDIDGTNSPIFIGSQLIRDLNSAQTGYLNNPSFGVIQIANENLKWETTTQANIGIDFNVYKRLSGSFDWYNKKTTDLYIPQPSSGINGIYNLAANNGSMENRGYELGLRFKALRDTQFKLDLFANGAKNTNEVTHLVLNPGSTFVPIAGTIQQVHQVGGPAAQYYVVPYIGLDPATGDQLFLDINGNVTTTPVEADRRATGRNRLPIYQGAFGFDASYKGFTLNTMFNYAQDFYKFDDELFDFYDPTSGEFFPVSNDLFNAWTPTNTNTDIPSTQSSFVQINEAARSDRFLMDASFVRVKSITLGYSVPSKFMEKIFIKSLRFYIQAENMLTWTKWRGLDPENFEADGQGKYPNSKSVSFGLDLKF